LKGQDLAKVLAFGLIGLGALLATATQFVPSLQGAFDFFTGTLLG
jgi:hypothetical protein